MRPRWVAVAAVGVALVAVPTIISLNAEDDSRISPASDQGAGGTIPWWEQDGPVERSQPPRPTASPTAQHSSEAYLIVGPEVPPRASRSSGKPAPAPAPSARPATFTALAGTRCPHDATRGFEPVGAFSDGTAGWYGRSSGGWRGDGCSGAFLAVPMSGDRDKDDTTAFAVWWFRTGAVGRGSCAISVYVPEGREPQDVAGHPAFYNVLASGSDYTRIGGFAIDQARDRGRWVDAGSYPLRNGQIAVRLLTRGEDPNGEHLAAAQLKVACRAA